MAKILPKTLYMHPYLRHEPLANTEEFFSTLLPMWIFDRVTLAFVEVNCRGAMCLWLFAAGIPGDDNSRH